MVLRPQWCILCRGEKYDLIIYFETVCLLPPCGIDFLDLWDCVRS